MDLHSQRPRKLGSTLRSLRNDRGRTTGDENKEEMTTADQRDTLMEWDWVTKKQPTSHKKRENEMMTTGNAAAPQSRFASINKMTHLKAAADLHSRTSRWVDVWRSRTMWRVLYKGWRYWVRLPRTKARKFGWETGVTDELRYLPTSFSGVRFFLVSLACSSPHGFAVFFVVLLRIRGFQRFEFVNSFQQQPVCLYLFFRVHLMIWCTAHCP